MAELEIGQHCSHPECKQLDFLPITCTSCGLIFCREHSFVDHHHCITQNDNVLPNYDGPKGYNCDFKSCGNRELLKVCCDHCQMNFCLQHRHQIEHDCVNLEVPEQKMAKTAHHVQEMLTKQAVAKESGTKPRKKLSKAAKATAAKVGLMKLKLKAVGNKGIPEIDRIFIQVLLPKSSKAKSKAIFFSKVWSVGKVIDAIASEVGIKNENNISGTKKLRVFDKGDGQMFETDKSLDDYIKDEILYNGGDVILEYVDEEVTFVEDYSSYKPA